MIDKLDIGCGTKKHEGYWGLDVYPYEGVDVVWNISKYPWPFEDNSFSSIIAFDVIEHIPNVISFFKECYRIAKPDAILTIKTPHFSSRNSWGDPTHIHHFSSIFCDTIVDGYHSEQVGNFKYLKCDAIFGKSINTIAGRITRKILGLRRWEKYYAFIMPAREIEVALIIKK